MFLSEEYLNPISSRRELFYSYLYIEVFRLIRRIIYESHITRMENCYVEVSESGFEIRTLNNLHAKLYLLDKEVFIGSANFTSNGWKLKKEQGNIEDMIQIELIPKELRHIEVRYLEPSKLLSINAELVSDIKMMILTHKSLLDQYKNIDKIIKDAVSKISKNSLREYFSKYYPPTKEFLYNFMFALAKSTGEGALVDKTDFQLQLGGSKDKHDASIVLPFSLIQKVLTKAHLDGANKSFQFQISIDDYGMPYLRSSNKVKNKEELFKLDRITLNKGALVERKRE